MTLAPVSDQVWAEITAAWATVPDRSVPLLCRVFGHDVQPWRSPLVDASLPAVNRCRVCGQS